MKRSLGSLRESEGNKKKKDEKWRGKGKETGIKTLKKKRGDLFILLLLLLLLF